MKSTRRSASMQKCSTSHTKSISTDCTDYADLARSEWAPLLSADLLLYTGPSGKAQPSPPWGRGWPATALSAAAAGGVRGSVKPCRAPASGGALSPVKG